MKSIFPLKASVTLHGLCYNFLPEIPKIEYMYVRSRQTDTKKSV